MILLDMNQLTIATIMAESKGKPVYDENLISHMIINNIRLLRTRHHTKYGELVLCYDNKTAPSWRKAIFPHYKAMRKERQSDFDWKKLYEFLEIIKDELKQNFPYHVHSIPEVEADDIIAVLAKNTPKGEQTLIVSNDGDFNQLICSYIHQYCPRSKELLIQAPNQCLFFHVISGDASDGIPNILSPDDCFVTKTRQVPLTKKKIETFQRMYEASKGSAYGKPLWSETSSIYALAHKDFDLLKRIERNNRLINFQCIPDKYCQQILEQHKTYKLNSRSSILPYLTSHKMSLLIDHATEF